jgi:hypothetical protein
MKDIVLYFSAVLIVILFGNCKKSITPAPAPDPGSEMEQVPSMNQIVGVDQFGRSFSTISSVKDDKQVGLFFWLWIGQPYASGIYDATNILNMPNGLKLLTDTASLNEAISPNGQAHFWGEPLWGYYNSEDVWVIRKQMEMLTVAGVDYIFFDATNAFIYKNVFLKLLAVIDEYQKKGWSPPKVAFYTHSKSFQTIRELYRDLYKPGLYPGTWYKVNGKPLIIGYTDPQDDLNEAKSRGDNTYTPGLLSNEILNFFHFKRPQWPSDPVYPDGFPWIEWIFPQPLHNGIMNVTVASHPSVPMSFSLTKGFVNWGRGWNPDTKMNVAEGIDKGGFFQRQWDYALSTDPDMITIGGWNEWIAYKQPYWDEYVLVDAVNKEYSRDIEPMKGGYEDAFYIQMIKNIRRYKGLSLADEPAKKKTITITSGASQWNDIPSIGININNVRSSRNAYGATTKILYSQPAPENHISDVKVAHDDKNVYFFIRAKDHFTSYNGKPNWLNVLVGTGEPALKNWESYEYLIGESFKDGNVSVGKLDSDFKTVSAGNARYVQSENIIQIECSREALGLTTNNRFYFKVAAGIDEPSEIMSYYTSGIAMPMGRLSYMYEFEK